MNENLDEIRKALAPSPKAAAKANAKSAKTAPAAAASDPEAWRNGGEDDIPEQFRN